MPHALIPCALVASLATALIAQDLPNLPEEMIFPNAGSGALLTATDASRDVMLGDVDGDGDLDAVVANLGANNALYINEGNFAFTLDAASPISNDGGKTMSGALGDIDGDGDLDIFLVNRSASEPNFLYINQGGAQLGTEGDFARSMVGGIATDVANSRGATFADIDADGDLDLYVANLSNESNFLYINQGGAQLGTEGTFARTGSDESETSGGVSHGAVFGDIDGDNDLDMFVPNGGGLFTPAGAVNFLFVNDGNGQFTRVMTGDATTFVANTKVALFADLDSDGDLDLFVANDTAQVNRVMFNDGNGNFKHEPDHLSAPMRDTNSAAIADLDGDGDLDIALANLSGHDNEVYMNNGKGRFAVQSLGPIVNAGGNTSGVAIGKLDADDRPDVVFVNQGAPAFIHRNDGSQWTDLENAHEGTAGMPRMVAKGLLIGGEPVTVQVHEAVPNSSAALVIGYSTVFAPLKGGVLVPAPDFVIFNVPTNAGGVAGLSGNFPVGAPSNFQINFQWWVADGGASNGFASSNAARALTP